ncbi:MAG TPA: hypothetical protein PKO06_23270 [Candidatus Ozemobacteraceae bacterium]|nr:hypothetical protein [Candidatus Ozemobacteraceae bacterium]
MKRVSICLCVVLSLMLNLNAFGQQSDLNTTNRVYFQELTNLAFGGYGDLDYWSKQSKLIAFRSAVHLTSVAISINADRDHGDRRMAKFKMIVELNKAMMGKAKDFAFGGYGDTDYWSKRTKHFATEIAMHCSTVAGMSDKVMLKAIQPKIETLLRAAQTAGFAGFGDVDYWSRRCKAFATQAIEILGEISTELATAVVQ